MNSNSFQQRLLGLQDNLLNFASLVSGEKFSDNVLIIKHQ